MSEHFGDDIEFDFFDEPETREDEPRRRAPRRSGDGGGPPRRPVRPPAGFTPLLRLAGLIAFAILIIVLLVLWVQSCQGASNRKVQRTWSSSSCFLWRQVNARAFPSSLASRLSARIGA